MSEYNGRRAPNFSQYLSDLNAIPSPYDQALQQQQQQQDSFNLDNELSLFTNTEFFDFDNFGDLNLPTFDSVEDNGSKKNNINNGEQNADTKFLDLLNDGLRNMPDYPSSDMNIGNAQPLQMQNTTFPTIPSGQSHINQTQHQSSPITANTPSSSNSAMTSAPAAASAPAPKRKPSQQKPSAIVSVEEASRVAAEEDKRRRNTAASARFRVKKKMREQALEKTVKETTDKNTALEARVTQLELENSWLKNLITEKNGALSEHKSESDIANMFKRFLATQKTAGDRRSSESKIGVGTSV